MSPLTMKPYTQEKIDALILCGVGAFITAVMLAVYGAEIIQHYRNNSREPIAWGAMIVVLAFDLSCAGLGWVLYRRVCRKQKMIGHCPKCGDNLPATPEKMIQPLSQMRP